MIDMFKLIKFVLFTGGVPSLPADGGRMDDGNEIFNSSNITWWDAQIHRPENHRRWECHLHCTLDGINVGCVLWLFASVSYLNKKHNYNQQQIVNQTNNPSLDEDGEKNT